MAVGKLPDSQTAPSASFPKRLAPLWPKAILPCSSARRPELERLGLPMGAMQEGVPKAISEIPRPDSQALKLGQSCDHRKWEG